MVRLGSSSGVGGGVAGNDNNATVVVRGTRDNPHHLSGRRQRSSTTAAMVPPHRDPMQESAESEEMQTTMMRRMREVAGGVGSAVAGGDNQMAATSTTAMMPAWLRGLMGETFFVGCGDHGDRRKNEKNIFCLGCCLSICPHCLPSHRSHPLLQVRRYVYHDVVRLDDLQKLIDCSYIQPYTINGAKVIFLNERAQAMRACKGPANVCFTCYRMLQHPFHFCSLFCKVDHLSREGQDLSGILYRFHQSDFAYTSQFEGEDEASEELDDGDDDDDANIAEGSLVEVGVQMENETEMEARDHHQLDPPLHFKPSLSCSSSHHGATMGSSRIPMPASVGNGSEMAVKKKNKKKGSGGFLHAGIVLSLNSCRRKGAPQRSPLS